MMPRLRPFLLLILLFPFLTSFGPLPVKSKVSIKSISKSMVFPVAGKKSKIRDLWGASRSGGRRLHKGIDIHARKGTPVVAICDGIIVERANTSIGGKTLWLLSEDYGWKAYYAHLDRQLVKEGQRVRKGQVIGTLGNTGNARTTPPHLHFGIAGGKGWVNPLPYVKHSPKMTVSVTKVKKKTTLRKRN